MMGSQERQREKPNQLKEQKVKSLKFFKPTLATTLAIVLAGLLSVRPAQAGYTVTLQQVGFDVVATGSGAIDLTGLTSLSQSGSLDPYVIPHSVLLPTHGIIGISMGPTSSSVDTYSGPAGPTSFGRITPFRPFPASWGSGELSHFHPQDVTMSSWLAVFYLVTMGSLAGYSAFTWLLQVRSATQVSTHAYVNPVVAVLLGVFFAGEKMSSVQLLGLAIILVSVLLINLAKYRASHAVADATGDAAKLSGDESVGKIEHSVVLNTPKAPAR